MMVDRPPESGRGSSVTAWREYAAAVTDTPVDEWAELTRDEIVARLDEQPPATEPAEPVARKRARPTWMVPTADGWRPESELLSRRRR